MGKWDKIKLGNACQISKGQQLNKVDLEKSGDYPCINGGIEPSGYTDKWNTEANTITISEGGNSCGYVNFIPTRFWSGGHCYSLLELKDNIDANFLFQALKGRESLIMGLRVGSGLPNIQQKAIKEFEFDYPENKPEQTRIAQILSKADEAIAQTEALIAKYQRMKTGLMQDLLTRGIDEHGNVRSKATHRFVVKNGIEVPEEWEVDILENMVENNNPICYGIVQVLSHTENGIPTVAIKDMLKNYEGLHLTDTNIEGMYKRSRIKGGDLLISVKGTTGRIDVTPKHFTGNISRDIAKIRLMQDSNPYFYKYYFESEIGALILDLIAVGSTRKEISIQPLKDIKVAKPSSDEQNKIVYYLTGVSNYIDIERKKLSKLQSLKTGLMQDLLMGRVRVKVKEEFETRN
jgi:type I restriction enzyme S subunit